MSDEQLLQRIVCDSRILTGKPVIAGTRLSVVYILNRLGHGSTVEEILDEYDGLCPEDVGACLLFAARVLSDTTFMPFLRGSENCISSCTTEIDSLIARWKSHGIECPPGVPESAIVEFEEQHNVVIPVDMRAYFLKVNGMGDRGTFDESFFNFWPLNELVTVADELPEKSKFLRNANQFFLFADHSISCPSYAIRMSANPALGNPVATVYADAGAEFELDICYGSFTEFVLSYLHNPDDTSAGLPQP